MKKNCLKECFLIAACLMFFMGVSACTFYDSSEPLNAEIAANSSDSEEVLSSSSEDNSSSDEKSSSSEETEESSSSEEEELSSSSIEGLENYDAKAHVFTDPRDKHEYKVVEIEGSVWFKENLTYNLKGSTFYDEGGKDGKDNLAKYGRLYFATNVDEACPAGSHLSTKDEWVAMIGSNDVDVFGKELISGSLGFDALLGGALLEDDFSDIDTRGVWIAYDKSGYYMYSVTESLVADWTLNKNDYDVYALYVRCVVNEDVVEN